MMEPEMSITSDGDFVRYSCGAGVVEGKMRSMSKTEDKFARRAPAEGDLPPCSAENQQA